MNALVVYKTKPAIVKEHADDKYTISIGKGTLIKVRDKDIEMLHPGPVNNLNEIPQSFASSAADIKAARPIWELLLEENEKLSLKELATFIFNEYSPLSAFTTYSLLLDGLYFTGDINTITMRDKDEVLADESKRNDKQREAEERAAFLEKIKTCLKNGSKLDKNDFKFMQDVEALALGKSLKSRTMKELGLSETPEDAHALLLKTGYWQPYFNPYPARFGLSLNSANILPSEPADEESCDEHRGDINRIDLSHLTAFAIDSPWSNDPDDALSIEIDETGNCILYVHVADVASSVTFNSETEKEARNRGATLYLPETTIRMLSNEFIEKFALGLSEKSVALTFKLTVYAIKTADTVPKDDIKTSQTAINNIEIEILPSIIKVQRLSYEEADILMQDENSKNGEALRAINELAMRLLNRRMDNGAINIELPDVHISVTDNAVSIQPLTKYKSAIIVRECMIAAGEAAGNWASSKGLPFPFLSQEAELITAKVPDGMAGGYQLRRCMRPRVYSTKPARHQGLGLDTYTQVTSPLRRYTDLLAHIQIRAFLQGKKTLTADEISGCLGLSEAATSASTQAERASDAHWIMVYLADKKDTVWEAVALEKKLNRWAVIIPALGLETLVPLQKDVSPNETVKLVLKSVNIPKREAVFVQG